MLTLIEALKIAEGPDYQVGLPILVGDHLSFDKKESFSRGQQLEVWRETARALAVELRRRASFDVETIRNALKDAIAHSKYHPRLSDEMREERINKMQAALAALASLPPAPDKKKSP